MPHSAGGIPSPKICVPMDPSKKTTRSFASCMSRRERSGIVGSSRERGRRAVGAGRRVFVCSVTPRL